jgi:hypothetical protein
VLAKETFSHIEKCKSIIDLSSVIQLELSEDLPDDYTQKARDLMDYVLQSTVLKEKEL